MRSPGTRFQYNTLAPDFIEIFCFSSQSLAHLFTNMVKITDYDSIGFDLDHTIIQYKLGNLFELIYKCLTEFLVHEKGYDACLLEGTLDDYKDFILRGHIFDTDRGNLLKLDKNGLILRASHGTRHMSPDEIVKCYGKERKFPLFQELKDYMITRHRNISNFRTFENFFDIPGSVIAARLVDIIDKKEGKQDKYTFWPDVIAGFILNFSPSSFAEKKGDFFPSITKTPAQYIKPCSSEMINWIKSLRAEKRKVFLLTNSFVDYASFLLEYAVGKGWRELFDVVICKASKPGFFVPYESGKLIPFYEVDDEKEVKIAEELHLNNVYSQGNNQTFMKHVRTWTGTQKPRILYFGDSAKSDIYPTYSLAKWDAAAVLEEMETEGMITLHHPHEETQDVEPRRKKAKLVDIEVEEGKEEVLMSRQWGSLFTDNTKFPDLTETPDIDNKIPDVDSKIPVVDSEIHRKTKCPDVILNGEIMKHISEAESKEFEAVDSREVHEMNTFWGDMIRRCSTIAIPTLDFISSLPLDHEFGEFDSTHSGFYPGIPKSLHKE